jgi:hypothetical protein
MDKEKEVWLQPKLLLGFYGRASLRMLGPGWLAKRALGTRVEVWQSALEQGRGGKSTKMASFVLSENV